MFSNIGLPELLIVLVILLLLFGAKKLPELSRSMGRSMREFKKGISMDDSADSQSEETNKKK